MRALVTGAGGFIGSRLCELLLDAGWTVRGVDCFTTYYDPRRKRDNLVLSSASSGFELCEVDLRDADVRPLIDGVDAVFHLAAQPGVRESWESFELYAGHNVAATQRLLAATVGSPVGTVVFASSSSVYGQVHGTVDEDAPTRPFSPYGVTKLAGEALCRAYADNYRLPVVGLRLFTVYGPRQRPDMAFARLIEAALDDEPFPLYGSGRQVRSFTFVDDVIAAFQAAADAELEPGTIVNIAGGVTTRLDDVVAEVGTAVGREVKVERRGEQPGDVARTDGSIERARELLGWSPQTSLRAGIAAQVAERVRRRGAP